MCCGISCWHSRVVIKVVISKITPGSPAARSPDIKVGDQLLEMNGTSLAGLSQIQVVNMVKQ